MAFDGQVAVDGKRRVRVAGTMVATRMPELLEREGEVGKKEEKGEQRSENERTNA